MKEETKTIIFPIAISAAISIIGFICNFYIFTPKLVQAEFERETLKDLLQQSSELYMEVNSKNEKTLSLFGSYGINSNKLDSVLSDYFHTINTVKKLNAKLFSFGSNEQIEFGKAYLENLYQIVSMISIQQTEVKQLELLIRESNDKIDKKLRDSVLFKQTTDKLDYVVQSENQLYFRLRDINFEKVKILSRINNYLYREKLGLKLTNDIVDAYKQLVSLDSTSEEFDYKPHKSEYLTARTRSLIHYKVDGGGGLDSIANQIAKLELLGRIMIEQQSTKNK